MDVYVAPLSAYFWTPAASSNNAAARNYSIKTYFSSSPEAASQMDALNGLYSRAYLMLGAADQLTGEQARANFSQPPTSSSDRKVADVAYFDKSYQVPQSEPSRYQFQVQQIASNQVNQGTSLTANNPAAVSVGTNTFLLTVGGTGYTLSVTINASDTNTTALSKIAQAIDAANTGVTTATVQGSGTVKLNLNGQNGASNSFSLADLSGNAVSATGINNSTQSAADAKFLMNGTTYIQPDNRVSLQNGHLLVDLKGAGEATITTGPQAMVDVVQTLTATMSSFGSYLRQTSYLKPELSAAWSGLASQQLRILSNYGFEGGSQGLVGLDTLTFTKALQANTAQTALAVSGLASKVRGFVKDLTSYPAADLLASAPASGYGAAYLSSAASAPWWHPGAAFGKFV